MSSVIKSSDIIFNDNIRKVANSNTLNIKTLSNNSIILDANKEKEFIIQKAIRDAKEIIEQANEKKILLQKEAIDEGNSIKQNAFNEGFEKGKLEGKKNGEQQAYIDTKSTLEAKNDEILAEFLKKIYLIEDSKDKLLKNYENKIISVALDLAKKIIKSELQTNNDIIKNMLMDSLTNYKKSEWIKVYVSEDDYIVVSSDTEIAEKLMKISDHVKIEKLSDKESGELVIETPDNIVDLGTENQLNNLENIIFGVQEN